MTDFLNYKNFALNYDTYKIDDDFYIDVMLPGFKKEDIKLDYDDRLLTIKIERAKRDDVEYEIVRSFYGKSQKVFSLEFEPEKIEAEFENGVLRIKLKKKKSKISIKF